jgi:hypothetical protein
MLVMGLSAVAYAGPGSVVIKTDGDITATFGAQVRFVPTFEQNWDFGIKESTKNLGGAVNFGCTSSTGGPVVGCLTHGTEYGVVSNGYIRSEDRLYFNFKKGDIWDVYFNLEYDDALSSRSVDRVRDTQGDFSAIGFERLNASIKLPWIYSRLNAGWDVYTVDLDAGSLVYTDDDPGFYIQGGVANIDWKFGYFKKVEANRRVFGTRSATVVTSVGPPVVTATVPVSVTNTDYDNDRDVYAARVNYTLFKDTKIGLIFAFNDQKVKGNLPTSDPCVAPTCQNVTAFHVSPIFVGSIAGFKIAAQYAHEFGDAEKMGVNNPSVTNGNYTIDSNAFFGDVAYDMTPWFGFRFIPHVGVLWTQGDDNPNDNKMAGYTGVANFQRFTSSFGGENTILADANPVVGTVIYSFIPDQRGNQNANLGTGGIAGTGRGDNAGFLLIGGGITVDPVKNWSYRTNAYYMEYNENFCLVNVSAAGACAATSGGFSNLINKHEIGVAWDNEISWWLDKNMVVKGQFSFLFPGDGLKQVTKALANNGSSPDETAIRLAMELLWNF